MKISIVIPAYNEELYIGKTLDSVLNLDRKDWEVEILVINSGSTDRTEAVAKSYGALVYNEEHKSIGYARKRGLEHAFGDFVLYTDADTILPTNWLIKHMEILETPGAVCSYGTFKVEDGSFPYKQITNYLQPLRIWIAYYLGLYYANGQNIGCRKKEALSIGGFDENLELLEDADFVTRMSKIGKVAYIPDCKVISSGRRSQEGLKFFLRAGWAEFRFFILKQRKFAKFPDYR
jgi:glycosyltransferase involved in cell wall biosynthesis